MPFSILNISFFAAEADVPTLLRALKSCVAPALDGVEHSWLRLEKIQGQTPGPDEPQSVALQLRFADADAMGAFRASLLDEAVERLHQVLPPDRCMVLQTELAQIDL